MTKTAMMNEIAARTSDAWEVLNRAQYNALAYRSDLGRGCGYTAACDAVNPLVTAERAEWFALNCLCETLGIEWDSTAGGEYAGMFWAYSKG